MSIELFNQLEQQVNSAVEAIEMLKMEAEELREENARLKQEHDEWEQRLSGLVTKFQALDTGDSSDTDAS
ncbi:cell division protein ZapB [Onishia niordana]|uniref:cell division protein ZapB n=1 Tax=Onishia niordana TaxID=2508711 RepID=UPI0010A05EE2|nr:cell division protein ZapB [Halomonas niordiana]